MKKQYVKLTAIILSIIVVMSLIVGAIYPFSVVAINKKIHFKPNSAVQHQYIENLTFFEEYLSNQNYNASTNIKLKDTLTVLANPIFINEDNNDISKVEIEALHLQLKEEINKLQTFIKNYGASLTTVQFNSIIAIKLRFEAYNFNLKNCLEKPFVSDREWKQQLEQIFENMILNLQEIQNFYAK